MAELNTGDGGGKKGGKVRSKKANSRVDLTAMVDLAFLLITFFMLTTSLSKPQSMDLGMPDKQKDKTKPEDEILVADIRSMTILMGENNKLVWYMGQFTQPLEGPTNTSYGKAGIRKEILAKVKSVPIATVDATHPQGQPLIVLIKPSKKSNYRNLVDILDEMAICGVKVRAVVDMTTEEEASLIN